jgi:rod shape determining protein RodA
VAKRSWRNFDFVLLGTLVLLSAYGVTMIYSATINTLGLESPVQRQITFATLGLTLLLVVASIDYGILASIQHPFSLMTPLVLVATSLGLLIDWGAIVAPEAAQAGAIALLPRLVPALTGMTLVAVVFLVDRIWLEKIDLFQVRVLAATVMILAIGASLALLRRLGAITATGGAPDAAITPYLVVAALAAVYLLDCLTLRITDILRNPLYVLMIALLGVTMVVGQVSSGSQRWLGAGKIQPSELAKILTIVVLAKILSDREERMEQFSTVMVCLATVLVPMAMIYLQPDLGTSLTLIAVWAAMIWMANVRFRHLLALGASGMALLPLVWLVLEDYMRDRLLLFINPASDPDSYFNVHQALVSIGSGGWLGKGLGHGTQSQLHFLRVRHTDFIFSVTAEELGFLGAMAMIGLLFLALWRVLRVVESSKDTFGRLIATGVGALVLFQTVVNIGMNLGLVPVTGIPLPFVSYGGSSFLTLMVAMGLVESVAMRRKKLEFG